MGADLMSGQIDLTMVAPTTFLSDVRAGKPRALGITGNTRSAQLPDVPPISDTVPGYEVKVRIGLVAPNGAFRAEAPEYRLRESWSSTMQICRIIA